MLKVKGQSQIHQNVITFTVYRETYSYKFHQFLTSTLTHTDRQTHTLRERK